jgi:hypothetical protein
LVADANLPGSIKPDGDDEFTKEHFAIGLEANNLTNEEIVLSGRQLNSPGGKTYSVQDSRYALTLRGNFQTSSLSNPCTARLQCRDFSLQL